MGGSVPLLECCPGEEAIGWMCKPQWPTTIWDPPTNSWIQHRVRFPRSSPWGWNQWSLKVFCTIFYAQHPPLTPNPGQYPNHADHVPNSTSHLAQMVAEFNFVRILPLALDGRIYVQCFLCQFQINLPLLTKIFLTCVTLLGLLFSVLFFTSEAQVITCKLSD